MDPKNSTYSVGNYSYTVVCGRCGKPGVILWDEVSRLNVTSRELISIEGPFFERLSKKQPYPIEMVCRACGEVAATAFPSTSLHARVKYN